MYSGVSSRYRRVKSTAHLCNATRLPMYTERVLCIECSSRRALENTPWIIPDRIAACSAAVHVSSASYRAVCRVEYIHTYADKTVYADRYVPTRHSALFLFSI